MKREPPQRALPFDIDIEQALIGALLIDENVYWRVAERLVAEDFYDPLHQRVFAAVKRLSDVQNAATPLTIAAALADDPGLAEVGGREYLVSLARATPAMPNVRDYAQITRSLAERRRIIQIGQDVVDAAFFTDAEVPPAELADRASQALYEATHGRDPGEGPVSLVDLSYRAVKDAESAYAKPDAAAISSGLKTIDNQLGKIYLGDLLVLGAATSMGKTSLVQKLLLTTALAGKAALMFSLEMRGTSIATRYIADASRVSSDRIRSGYITEKELDRIVLSPADFAEFGDRFSIDSTPRLSVSQMRARAEAFKRRHPGLALIVIDHLQFIDALDPKANTDEQARQITRDLCAMAKDLNVAVVLISHLTKENEKRNSKRPIMADLYGSGGIAQNADSVWFLYRAHYYLSREQPDGKGGGKEYDAWVAACDASEGKAEIFSTKVRQGKTNSVTVGFEEAFTRFYDIEKEQPTASQAGLGLIMP